MTSFYNFLLGPGLIILYGLAFAMGVTGVIATIIFLRLAWLETKKKKKKNSLKP